MDYTNLHSDFETLVGKYFADSSSLEETILIEDMVKSNPLFKEQFVQYKRIWHLTNPTPKTDTSRAWSKISSRINDSDNKTIPISRYSIPQNIKWGMGIAATILLLISVYLFLNIPAKTKEEVQIADLQPQTIILKDETEVTLNSGSKIRYPEKFNSRERRVVLEGDAYFQVSKSDLIPFVVETPYLDIKVLGTTFYVDNHLENDYLNVIVTSGRVALIRNGKIILELETNQQAHFDKKTGRLTRSINKDPNVISWKTGKISFDDSNLETVAMVLSKTYNVKVTVVNSDDSTCRLTAEFQGKNLDDVLEIIQATLQINYHIEEKGIVIEGSGCH